MHEDNGSNICKCTWLSSSLEIKGLFMSSKHDSSIHF